MKPLVDLGKAWCCTVFSILCIIILGVFAILFNAENHELVGHVDNTKNAQKTATALAVSCLIYVLFIVFCVSQIFVHKRQPRAIALR